MPTTCIIPAFNESSRIHNTLSYLTKVPAINEIIVIDDGSTDDTFSLVKNYFPNILTLHHSNNLGKAAAVKSGLRVAHQSNILLFDADVLYFHPEKLSRLVTTFDQKHDLDCLFLRHDDPALISLLFNAHLLLTGLRLIRLTHLKGVFDSPISRYQLEIAINDYCLTHHLNLAFADLPNTRLPLKVNKMKPLTALLSELSMYKDIFTYHGNHSWFYQRLFLHPPPLII